MALSKLDPRMAFDCEQTDKFSGLTSAYVLYYYYDDGTLEMIRRKDGKASLMRHVTPLKRSAFFIGSIISIHGKLTTITGYADVVTTKLCEDQNERSTLVVCSGIGMDKLGKTIAVVMEELGMTVVNIQLIWIKGETVEHYSLPENLIGTSVVVLQCVSSKCLEKGVEVMKRIPGVLAATDQYEAEMWGELCRSMSSKPLVARREENSTVVVLKPHAIQEKVVGNIVQIFCDAGLEITGFTQLSVTTSEMDKFLQPYRGVLPDIEGTVRSMTGTLWVMQLMSPQGMDVLQVVRTLCGPYDSVLAKKLYPRTIRGQFGKTQCENAVHCCDIPGEGPVYANFFFRGISQ